MPDWRAWLRRVAGPDPELVRRAEAKQMLSRQLETLRATYRDTCAAHAAELALARAERDAARRSEAAAQRIAHALVEPPPAEGCGKVRLRSRAEAEGFARKVERDTGAPDGALRAYRCEVCPRQPAVSDRAPGRFWHVGNIDRAEVTGAAQPRRTAAQVRRARERRNGQVVRLGDAVSPEAAARLRDLATDDPA
jgi:hypothetical protein